MWVQMCKLVMLLECWLAHSFLEPYRMSLDDDFVCFCAPCLRYVRYSKTTPKTANSLSFSSVLLRGVHARASVEQLREMRTGHFPPRSLCHARGHLPIVKRLMFERGLITKGAVSYEGNSFKNRLGFKSEGNLCQTGRPGPKCSKGG